MISDIMILRNIPGKPGSAFKAFFLIFIINTGIIYSQVPVKMPQGNEAVKQWVEEHFTKDKIPPFSFMYGGKSSDAFIKGWKFSAEKIITASPDLNENIFTYSDTRSGLEVKCHLTWFSDFPAVEWVLRFSNASSENSPVIEKAAVIDQSFSSGVKGAFILHHSRGILESIRPERISPHVHSNTV